MIGKSKQSEKVDLCIVSLVIKAHQKLMCKSTFFSKIENNGQLQDINIF